MVTFEVLESGGAGFEVTTPFAVLHEISNGRQGREYMVLCERSRIDIVGHGSSHGI